MKNDVRKTLMACILSLTQLLAYSAEIAHPNVKMTRVEVFRNGAQVYKQVAFTPKTQIVTVRVKDIPADIDPSLIRVKALGGQKIVSFQFDTDYAVSEATSKQSEALKDSIEGLDFKLSMLYAEQTALETQELLLLQNMKVVQESRGVEEVEKMLILQKKELSNLKKDLVKLKYQKAELELAKTELKRKFELSSNQNNPLAGVIVMEVVANPNTVNRIEISYLVADAWWTPVYDIRVESVHDPLELEYRAEVYQNSNEDWTDVKLQLFSNNPEIQGTLGDLETWKLNYNSSAPVYKQQETASTPSSQLSHLQSGLSGVVIEKGNGLPVPFANVVVKKDGRMISGTQTDFDGKYHIPSISPGQYDLEITYLGFHPARMNNVVLNPQRISKVDIELSQSAQELMEVAVNYKEPMIRKDAVASGYTIKSNELMKTVGGVSGGGGSINVRGGRSDDNYYYIDGIKVRGSSGIPPSAYVERGNHYGTYPSRDKGTLFMNDQTQEEELREEFETPGLQSVPSSKQVKLVYIKSREVDAHYVYRAVPRLDSKVYLYAEISDWESLGLSPGKTNLYYSNTFVGETDMNVLSTEDTLKVSLGPDKNIQLSYDLIDDQVNPPGLGSNSVTKGYEIKLKSNKDYAVNVRIEDQIPVAVNDDFAVNLLEENDAILDQKTGIIKWEFTLEPRETSSKSYKYIVKFPKGVRLAMN